MPFIKITIPLILGIFLQSCFNTPWGIWIWTTAALITALIAYSQKKANSTLYTEHYTWALYLGIAAIGAFTYYYTTPQVSEINNNTYPYSIVTLTNNPLNKGDYLKCEGEIISLIDNKGKEVPCKEKAILYFRTGEESGGLRIGDLLILTSKWKTLAPKNNFISNGYEKKLAREGVFKTAWYGYNDWELIGEAYQMTFAQKALKIRNQALSILAAPPITTPQHNLLCALTLGYKENFDKVQKQQYRDAGLAHTLAVSGLHVGILYFLLFYLLYPLRLLRIKWLQLLLVCVGVWGYAYLTALSPSVVRAAIMSTFLTIALLFNRRNSGINALTAAAFFILLYSPRALWDIGFQLSFCAVGAILYIEPYLSERIRFYNKPLQSLLSTIAITIAVTIVTAPLSLYYFGTLPTLQVFSNLLVIPLLPIIMGGGLLTLALGYMHLPTAPVINIISYPIDWVNSLSSFIASLPYATLQISFNQRFVFYYLLLLATILLLFKRKNATHLLAAVALFVAITIAESLVVLTDKPTNKIIAYNNTHNNTINIISHNENILLTSDTLSPFEEITPIATPVWRKYTTSSPLWIKAKPYYLYKGKKILFVTDNRWDTLTTTTPLIIDYLFVGKGHKGNLDTLQKRFSPQEIILLSSLHPTSAKRLYKEAQTLNLPCHWVREMGDWVKELNIK